MIVRRGTSAAGDWYVRRLGPVRLAATSDTSAWYFGNNVALIGMVVALALWAFWKAVPRNSPLAKT